MNIWLVCIAGAYLLGSIPFGVMIGRARGVNILQHGSKNPGATNVARLLGKPLGTLCFILDVGKGAAPILITGSIFDLLGRRPASLAPEVAVLNQTEMWLWLAVACAAIAGHMWSPFLAFRGGKGVATGFGAMVAMWEVLTFPALGAIVVWYGVLRLTRYVSLASVLAAASLPVGYALSVLPRDTLDLPLSTSINQVMTAWPPLAVTALMAVVVIYKHRSNIARIRRGEEPQVRGVARRGDVLEESDEATERRSGGGRATPPKG
ncbi:MAG: glycerol-3-phosphate 1-O-acyltransferase PlsY [Planctomycetota bacterium]|jgi:glycerol-3-phosphate acyltransferase PlsY